MSRKIKQVLFLAFVMPASYVLLSAFGMTAISVMHSYPSLPVGMGLLLAVAFGVTILSILAVLRVIKLYSRNMFAIVIMEVAFLYLIVGYLLGIWR